MSNGAPPRLGQNLLGSDSLQTRAAHAGDIWEARHRAREQVTEQFETVEDRREVPIRRRGEGFGPAQGFLDWAQPREAAHQLDPQFPRQDLGPADVTETDQGFRATEGVRRRSAAFEFEESTPLSDVDPFGDLTAREGGGFGLDQQAQREVAAEELDPQFPLVDLGPGDVTETDQGFGLRPSAEEEIAAERFEEQTPLDEVGTGDVRRTDSGFELRESVIRENRGLFR